MTDVIPRTKAEAMALEAPRWLWRKRNLRAKIALKTGLPWQGVSGWKKIPAEHMFLVARLAGVPVYQVRPDIFLDDPVRMRATALYVHGAKPVEPRLPLSTAADLTETHRLIWVSEDYAKDDAAAEAATALTQKRISAFQLRRRFGPSGRRPAAGCPAACAHRDRRRGESGAWFRGRSPCRCGGPCRRSAPRCGRSFQ